MRTRLTLAAGTAALALTGSILGAAPAHAADTTTTFTLTAGSLSISAPASAALGSVATSTTASSISGALGQTTVTDGRGALAGAYAVTLTSTDFVTGGGTTNEKLLAATVTSWSGAVTHTNSGGTEVETTSVAPAANGTTVTSLSAFSGTDTATYNPTVKIPIPATNVAGAYSGTITQTVLAVV